MTELQNALTPIIKALPSIIGAIVLLLVGYWLANFISNKVGKAVEKNSKLKEMSQKLFGTDEHDATMVMIVAKAIFFVIILLVIGAALEMLGLKMITEPINKFLGPVFAFIPNLIAAVIVAIIAYVIASLVKMLVVKFAQGTNLDNKMAQEMGKESSSASKALGDVVFWVIIFFFLPLILSSLQLNDILYPLQNMINKILAFIPNIFTAAIILVVGLFIAKKLRDVVTVALASFGVDKFLKGNEEAAEKDMKLSAIIGLVVYILILVPVISAVLSVLGFVQLSAPINNMIDSIFVYLPVLFSAAVIVFIAYIVGKIIGDIVTGVVGNLNLEKPLQEMGVLSESNTISIGQVTGKFVHVLIVFFAVLQATEILGFTQLTVIAQQLLVLASQIALGLIVIGVGFYLANAVAKIIKSQQTKSADTMALIARVVIIFLAVSMGLNQMGVADNIVNMAFGFIVGAVALAAAIAFGVGGREEAAKILKEFREKK